MPLEKIPLIPGIHREGTQYSEGASWWDCDKIRFRKGFPEKIGGWVKYISTSYMGVARSLFDWGTGASIRYLGIGTNLKFYVETGEVLSDITPLRKPATAASSVTFSLGTTTSLLKVTNVDHGASVGDFVTFFDAIGLGGNILAEYLNQEYRVASLIDADNFNIIPKDTSGNPVLTTAGDTGDGLGATYAEYQINIGTNSYVPAVGWGVLGWGVSPWGGGGTLTFAGQLRLYSQDSFGDNLVFNPRAGGVFAWIESDGTTTRAKYLYDLVGASDAPIAALQVMTSPTDRHVICFGCNPIGSSVIDPLLVRWGTQESMVDWTPTVINSAGGQVISTGTQIVGAVKTRHEIVIFTDTSIHAMRFTGSPYVFGFSPLAENITILSQNAAISTGDAVYFMDLEGFYLYQGSVVPIVCDVLDYVFENIDKSQLHKVYGTNNPSNSEVTWFYPAGSAGSDITNYVTFNYMDKLWTIGTFNRGAWIQAPTKNNPIASSNDTVNEETNYLYTQEYGYDADGLAMGEFIESGAMEMGSGESMMFCDRVIPDFRWSGVTENANLTVKILKRKYPLEDMTVKATKTVYPTTKQSSVRVRGREMALRIEGNGVGYGWTMGQFRFDIRPDGKAG